MGKDDVAAMFEARSQRWTNHFDRATLLMRGRGANGTWREPFDPTKRTYCTQRGGDYTESNAREYTWFVPHDPMGLIEAFGGKETFVRELSDFFWKHREYRHDNEPGHQAPYQFVFAGRPDLTARIVRETVRNSYFATSHSMRGNDDCGQMSAWYLFSSFGFYPFDGFSATYVLGAPQIPEATLSLPGGRRLHITAPGLSEEAMYVRRVTFNGKTVSGPTISHAELMQGGELVFEMVDKPTDVVLGRIIHSRAF
jgi:predicted alpha-1,2-mannosidase